MGKEEGGRSSMDEMRTYNIVVSFVAKRYFVLYLKQKEREKIIIYIST